MRAPSGLKRGCMSKAAPLVSRVASAPAGAFDRHQVEIAEDVEDDRLPIGAHIDVDPRSFLGLEIEGARRTERLLHVPLRRILRERGHGKKQQDRKVHRGGVYNKKVPLDVGSIR